MSSPDRISGLKAASLRRLAVVAGVAMLSTLSACTVSPLYSSSTAVTGFASSTAEKLAQVSVGPVTTRPAQQVRNHLIFLFNGGAGEPANPAYSLDLSVGSGATTAAKVQLSTENDGRPSAGEVVMTASYILKDLQTGEVIGTGTRQMNAAHDRPRQEYAVLRAERDAEDRAAREVAEFIRLSVAQDLDKASRM